MSESDYWLRWDYRSYLHDHDLQVDCGNLPRFQEPDTFEAWLARQPAEYRARQGVELELVDVLLELFDTLGELSGAANVVGDWHGHHVGPRSYSAGFFWGKREAFGEALGLVGDLLTVLDQQSSLESPQRRQWTTPQVTHEP